MAQTIKEFELYGLQELEANLLALAKEFGPRNARTALNKPLKEAMEPVENDIRNNTPVDSGVTKESVKMKMGTGPINKSSHAAGARIVAAVNVGWYRRPWLALVNLEYGNSRQPPANVIRGSLENNTDRVLNRFNYGWEDALRKRGEALNKRKKLGKLKYR